MSNSKNYNRIAFLTTLSVYLSLALAGGSAPVLAQTIDDRRIFQTSVNQIVYDDAVSALVHGLEKLAAEEKFDWSKKIDINYQFRVVEIGQPFVSVASGEMKMPEDIAAFNVLHHTAEKISRDLNRLENNFSGQDTKIFDAFAVSVSLDESGITLKASRSGAGGFFANLQNLFEQKAARGNDSSAVIYENTKISSENNQVFIVTRLPRASIDALLAKKAAK